MSSILKFGSIHRKIKDGWFTLALEESIREAESLGIHPSVLIINARWAEVLKEDKESLLTVSELSKKKESIISDFKILVKYSKEPRMGKINYIAKIDDKFWITHVSCPMANEISEGSFNVLKDVFTATEGEHEGIQLLYKNKK